MDNFYEYYTIGEVDVINNFWQKESNTDNNSVCINFGNLKIGCNNYEAKINGCAFESLIILSQYDILEQSKKYPLINFQLYYYWPSDTLYSNGEGLFGIWELKNGKVILSVQCSYSEFANSFEKDFYNGPNPIPLFVDYLIYRQEAFKINPIFPKDFGHLSDVLLWESDTTHSE
jgi:hypothetical protein